MQLPKDIDMRLRALTDHGTTMLVEAGAGSGKTSTMAGRVALLIAGGEDPASIVAISYTVAAASELRARIEKFLQELAHGVCPKDLVAVFPEGVPIEVTARAKIGLERIDGLAATTIHGFCQILLKPYPLEAGMDPGATIVDPQVADLAFEESLRSWLTEILNAEAANFTAELFERNADAAQRTVREVAFAMRKHRGMLAPEAALDKVRIANLAREVDLWLKAYPAGGAGLPAALLERVPGFVRIREVLGKLPADPIATLLCMEIPDELRLKSGGMPSKACNKGDWVKLLGPNAGDQRNVEMTQRFDAFKAAWSEMKRHCAAVGARKLTEELSETLKAYRDWKTAAAYIDFDDLLVKARDLLASQELIRRRLGERFRRVLVDEFQDTDPIQAEILWRLCGDPAGDANGVPAGSAERGIRKDGKPDWQGYQIRPGSLFLVGDPKQAIYRFRGADIGSYLNASNLLKVMGGVSLISIFVNFRSTEQVLAHVNRVYEPVMVAAGQPGFTKLEHHRADVGALVQCLDLEIPADAEVNNRGEVSMEVLRETEARGIAETLKRIIGSAQIVGKDGVRKVEPGDVALLMPSGTDFWIYETELERAGIPIAAQAGKGFLMRQEILDMTALARLLSDSRDTVALGAFLRGPVLGFTDEEILDAIDAQPLREDRSRKRLSLSMDLDLLPEGRFKDAMANLRFLRKMGRTTTPYQTLSAAVEIFAIRANLMARHPRSVERSFANLDAYLGLSRAWDIRGLKSFADEIRRRMEGDTPMAEGRPDIGSDAVSMVTIHSSKGLEWPIVIPINLATAIVDRAGPIATEKGLLLKILGEEIEGYNVAQAAEKAELTRERHRLLYVADTRARDLLLVPKFKEDLKRLCWMTLCPGRYKDLTSFDGSAWGFEMPARPEAPACADVRDSFQRANDAIVAGYRPIERRNPSRHEAVEALVVPEILSPDEEPEERMEIRGGADRGLVLHKLMEEVLTGETQENDLPARAAMLSAEIEAHGLDPDELTDKVLKTLALPEIAAVRDRLVPELDVGRFDPAAAALMIGTVDAAAVAADGKIDLVVDWKSDVNPSAETILGYIGQVSDYLRMAGGARGLIIFMTSGRVIPVAPPQV